MTERFAVLGASRGLGSQFVQKGFLHFPKSQWLLVSRKTEILETLVSKNPQYSEALTADFSKPEGQNSCLEKLRAFEPTRLIYMAAGGPHGAFQDKSWKDHLWSFEVSFVFPARVTHFGMSHLPTLKQIVLIGSSVAENQADPMAASYCSSKHALRGLVTSIRKEKPEVDLRLYSPGYMDTDLLPQNAWPRQQGRVSAPAEVAQDLLSWLFVNDESGHRLYK